MDEGAPPERDGAEASKAPEVSRAASRLRRELGGLRSAARAVQLEASDPQEALAAYEEAVKDEPVDPTVFAMFAAFLARSMKDSDRAEAMYERAIAGDPDNANNLGNYAIFLRDDRKDFDRAEAMYERAIAADPDNADNLGNYAQLLFARASDDRAESIVRALLTRKDLQPSLGLELLFYIAAHLPQDDSVGPALRRAVDSGTRSAGWSFRMNLDRITRQSDARLDFLERLAAVVSDERPPESLEGFDVWHAWGGSS